MHHYGGNVVPSPETQSNSLTTATMTWVQSYNGTFSNTVGESLSLAAASVEDCDLFAAWTCCLFLPWRAIEERVWKYFPQLEAVLHLSNFKCQDYYKKKKSPKDSFSWFETNWLKLYACFKIIPKCIDWLSLQTTWWCYISQGFADGFIIIVSQIYEAILFNVADDAASSSKFKNILTNSLFLSLF